MTQDQKVEGYGVCGLAYAGYPVQTAGPTTAPGGKIIPGGGTPTLGSVMVTPPCLGPGCQLWVREHGACSEVVKAKAEATTAGHLSLISMNVAKLVHELTTTET